MTTREKAHRLLDELPESEIEPLMEIMASRGKGKQSSAIQLGSFDETGEPEMARLPEGWGETLTGEPMPNVVAAVRRSRADH